MCMFYVTGKYSYKRSTRYTKTRCAIHMLVSHLLIKQ